MCILHVQTDSVGFLFEYNEKRQEKDVQIALNKAVDYCIENGILKEFLLRNRAEVLGMLLEEFDVEKYERTIREEGRGEGRKEGRKEVNRLGILMTEAGRSGEFLESLSDRELQKKLFIEFGLEEEKQGSGII